MQQNLCPCGSELQYQQCCEKIISGVYSAETPEQLMRSRYTAYVIKNESYLLHSWHSSSRPANLEIENDKTIWKYLKIISADNAYVQFVAYFQDPNTHNDALYALHEKSEFKRENNQWFYLSGKDLKTITLTKNMSCPCGSGKKFKRCCENKF